MATSSKSASPRRKGRVAFAVVVLLALALGLVYAALPPVDLRPPGARGAITDESAGRARAVLSRMADAHGGLEAYRAAGPVTVVMQDTWPSDIARALLSPWAAEEGRFELTFAPASDDSELRFLDGPRSEVVWGIEEWNTYTRRGPGEDVVHAPDGEIEFWLPTLEYFLEMAFRIGEADVVAHVGERTVGERSFDVVYATWNDAAPQSDIDQYLLWVAQDTGLLEHAQYTVRDKVKLIVGTMSYGDFRVVDGLMMPFSMTAGGTPQEPETMHRLDVESLVFGAP